MTCRGLSNCDWWREFHSPYSDELREATGMIERDMWVATVWAAMQDAQGASAISKEQAEILVDATLEEIDTLDVERDAKRQRSKWALPESAQVPGDEDEENFYPDIESAEP